MFDLKNNTKRQLPRLPFSRIKDAVLGKNYELSLVFVGDKTSKDLNKKFRQKDYPANVLSFPYDKNSGEIFINLKKAEKEARDEGVTFNYRVGFLFIHGMLHLKGFLHGSRMDEKELYFAKQFLVYGKKHNNRNRHRNIDN